MRKFSDIKAWQKALCEDVNEVKRMLYAFIRSIKAND